MKGIIGNRIPPNSVEAEIAVIGAMMLKKEAISIATSILTAESFYNLNHKTIFTAIVELSKKNIGVDIITLSEELLLQGQLESVGGRGYLAIINKQVATSANVEKYSLIVREREFRRQLIDIGGTIVSDAYDMEKDALQAIDLAEAEIFKMAEKRMKKEILSMPEMNRKCLEYLHEMKQRSQTGVTGLPTGLIDLDKYLCGLQDSELIIIAARPSMGKTALGLTIAKNLCEFGKSVAFFSLEMAYNQLIIRLLSGKSKVNQQKLRTGETNQYDDQKIIEALQIMDNYRLFIDDSSMMDIMELRSKCRKLKAEHNIDAVFVDYLQLIRANGLETREREIALISMTLKQIAKELSIPVVALAQLNRSIESRPGKSRSPLLSDLRESGSIEQDADVIIFVQRAEVYGITEYEDKTPTDGTAELIIGKQRNGPIGTVRTAFVKNYAQFDNLSFGYEEPPNRKDF